MEKSNNKASILIAEDENIIAKDIELILKDIGYDVLGSVRTGKEIIEKAVELEPDLIMMDIMLEGEIDGVDASQKIKDSLNIPVIFLTALADSETLERAKITDPFGYLIKPFDRKSLHTTIEMALYKHSMDLKLMEKTLQLEEEKIKSDNLLNNIFPSELVNELKEKGVISPREYKNVTLLFTDFQGFTNISSQLTPAELVDELNDIFQNFDTIIEKYKLEKLKTIGDSYMIAGGLPLETDDHAEKVISAAIEMHDFIDKRNKNSKQKWEMRSGAHSGKVVAGVIGKKKYTYDVWGDTVNIASRMEKYSKPGEINVTQQTKNLIEDKFTFKYYDDLNYSNDKLIKMYFVKDLKS